MRRWFVPLTLILLFTFLLVGCGGGSDATATTAKPTTGAAATTAPNTGAAATTSAPSAAAAGATRPAGSSAAGTTAPAVATSAPAATTSGAGNTTASGGTIKIGMITSLTGPYNPLGTFNKQAAELLVKQVNDAGGINGAKIELSIEDDQSNPSNGPTAVKKMIANKVVAIIGPVFSSTCVAILDDVEAAKIPMITQCATDSQVNPIRPNIFMAPPTTTVVANQLLAYLKSEGKTKVTVLHDSTEFGSTGWNVVKADASKYGITPDEQLYELTGTTFVPQLTKIKNSDTQAVISWGSGAPAVTIAKEYKQLGLAQPLLFSHAQATPLFLKPAGDAANGVIIGTSLGPVGKFLPDSNASKPAITKFDADFQAAYNTAPAEFAYNTYGAFNMIVNAVKKVGPDSAKIRAELEQTTFVSVDGTYKYSATNHAGLGPESVLVAMVTNGALEPTKFSAAK